MEVSASLVLYKNEPEMVRRAVMSLLSTPIKISLSVIDNSPSPELSKVFDDLGEFDVDYFYNNGENFGFGKAHNLALGRVKKYDYHLVMNPDIYFESNAIVEMVKYLDNCLDIGLVAPQVYSSDREIQYLCKRYPTVFVLFARRFIPKKFQFLFKKQLDLYEMRDTGYDKIMEPTLISGCFMLFRRAYLDEVGYFDDNIFMYFEDYDLSIRMAKKYKIGYFPHAHIYHYWTRGAHNSTKLALIFIRSGIYFFNKHGWKLI